MDKRWWTELWSFGAGPSRVYGGVAQTDAGFAVDVFSGDACIESEIHRTRQEAARAAMAFERLYRPRWRLARHLPKHTWLRRGTRPSRPASDRAR